MKKFIITLLGFGIFIPAAFASEITKIDYSGPLKTGTEIKIHIPKANTCKNIKIGNQSVETKNSTDTNISFEFQENFSYKGIITLECENQTLSQNYSFPFISRITGFENKNFEGLITITGENFSEKSNILLSGDSFQKTHGDDRTIAGKIGKKINKNILIVQNDKGLQSNEFEMNIQIPKISYITTPTLFKKGEKLIIHGTNLNSYNKTQVQIGNTFVSVGKFGNDTIEITIPEIDGTHDVSVISNNISSNSLKILFLSDRPVISQIKEETEVINGKNMLVTYINGKNFSTNNTTQVLINGKNVSIHDKVSTSLLILRDVKYDIGNNFLEVRSNGLASEVFNMKKTDNRLPNIGGITTNFQNDTHKVISVFIDSFDIETDKIYFNNKEIPFSNCVANSCLVNIPKDTLFGEFSVGRANYRAPKTIAYDVRTNEVPHISYISFVKSVGDTSYFEIFGHNLETATISNSNVFSLNDKKEPDIVKRSGVLTGFTPRDLTAETKMSLTVSQNNYSSTLEFYAKDMGAGKTISGPSVLYEVRSINGQEIYKPGEKIELVGKNFSPGETVNIGTIKAPLLESQNKQSYPYFIIPEIPAGKYDVSLTNSQNQTSNKVKMLVIDKNANTNITAKYSALNNLQYYVDTTADKSKPLYAIDILNTRKKLLVKEISFKLESNSSLKKIGTFHLKLNKNIVGNVEKIDDNSILKFENFYLDISDTTQKIELFKDSDFIENIDFSVELHSFELLNVDRSAFTELSLENMMKHTIQVFQKSDDLCIDSETSKIHCNSYLVGKTPSIPTPPTPVVPTPITPPKTETQNPVSQKTTIELEIYDFQRNDLKKFQMQMIAFSGKIEENNKYISKLPQIETTLNNILKSLWDFENASGKKASQKVAFMRFQNQIKELKKLLK